MNPEVKTKWVNALRSGKYQQGRMALNDNGKFCCLGVLCEVAVDEGIIVKDDSDLGRHINYGSEEHGFNSTSPTTEVLNWAGLGATDPVADGTTLMTLNDEDRKDFNYIADVIEKEF